MNILQKLKEYDAYLDDILSGTTWAPQAKDRFSMAIGLKNRSNLLERILIPQEDIASIKTQDDLVYVELNGHGYYTHQFPKNADGDTDYPIVEKATVYLYRLGENLIGRYPCAQWDVPSVSCDYMDGRYGVRLEPTLVFRPSPF